MHIEKIIDYHFPLYMEVLVSLRADKRKKGFDYDFELEEELNQQYAKLSINEKLKIMMS